MTTIEIDKILHALKPDGHKANPLATELHRIANSVQELSDKAHAAITFATRPNFKGDVVGELHPWPDHYPLELDHSGSYLHDIMVRGESVSEHLASGMWGMAESYVKGRFSADTPEDHAAQQKITRLKESEACEGI